MRRVAPAFALFFLAPLVAEYLLGDFPPASSRRASRCSRAAVREDPGKSRCPRPARRVCSAGTDNAMYRLGDDMAVRLPRVPGAVADVDKEQRWLPRLSPLLPLAVPVPLGRGVPDDGFPYPWSVYRWLDGANAVDEPIVELSDAAAQLGRFAAALRRGDATGGPRSFRGGPISARDDDIRGVIRDLAAVIDFGGLGVGDPACDMLPAWTLLTAQTRELFRAAAEVDDATWARGRGWGLYLGLGAVHVYRVTNPVLGAIGRHAVAEVLADYHRSA